MKDYCSLHNKTTYSIMNSLIKPSELFLKAKELGQSAIAVTDLGTLGGAWDCLKYSREAGIKLIMGCEFYFTEDLSDQSGRLRHIILIAKNAVGYRNLLALNKSGYDNHIIMFKKVVPRINWELLEKYNEGLICTTACGGGILSQLINTRKFDEAKKQAMRLKAIFGESLALEIQPHGMRRVANLYKDYEDQNFTNRQLIKLGKELDIKVVAATDAHYLTPDQHAAHDVMLAMGSGQPIKSGNRLKYIPEFHVKSRDEVRDFFAIHYPDQADEFCDNSLFFANMCENPDWIDPKFSNPSGKELPEFPVQKQSDYSEFKSWQNNQLEKIKNLPDDAAYLRYWCDKDFDRLLPYVGDKREEYVTRLEEEFGIIEFHGFSSYLLIVADALQYCRNNNIIVGPGRGSVGGSLCAYLTGIHQLDPIEYGLIFSRFLNRSKTAYPDVDNDIASSDRDKLLLYIYEKYGHDKVAHVGNVIFMKPKVYVKDIARTFEYGGDQKTAVAIGAAISDSILIKPGENITVEEALKTAPLFAEFASQEKYKHLKEYAGIIGNKPRNVGVHAAGFVISKRNLAEIIPIRKDKNGEVVTEYEKERVEANGLVKIDFLGVKTLDIIANTYKLIKEVGKEAPPNPPDHRVYDKKTYDLISVGNTLCVFQFGTSGGTIQLCKAIKPKSIKDLAIINALARPSAEDIREKLIEVRDGKKEMELLHPILNRAFGSTYGFGLYEECLMYLAQDVAGWDLHKADDFRKLTKDKGKYPEKTKKLKEDFIKDSVAKGLEETIVIKIWDEVIDKFAGYGFNVSHASLYSLPSFYTAYLKAHFPLEFLTSNLMVEVNAKALDSKDKIIKIKNEIRQMKVNITSPDINTSEMSYKIISDNTLMTGLDSLKNIGKDAIPEILAKRPFTSFEDFLSKVDGKKVRAPAVQALAASGCLDSFGMTRKAMYLYAGDYKKKLQVWLKKTKKEGSFNYPWPEIKEDWTMPQKYAMENFYLGEGLSGNKFQIYSGFFNKTAVKFSEFGKDFPDPGDSDVKKTIPPFQAEIKGFFEFKVKKENSKSFGKLMGKVLLEDPWGSPIMMTVFPKQWPQFKERIKLLTNNKAELSSGVAIYARGYLNWYAGDISIVLEDLLKCVPPPTPPSKVDLVSQKVSMRTLRTRKVEDILERDQDEVLEMIEDELVEEGLSQIDGNDWEIFEDEDFINFDVFN